jgi:hypothetical protein
VIIPRNLLFKERSKKVGYHRLPLSKASFLSTIGEHNPVGMK